MNYSRRDFIRLAAAGGAFLCAAPAFNSCASVTRSDINYFNKPMEAKMESILYYASLAANGHNTQPWSVKIINDKELLLRADHSRRLPAVDPDNREMIISLGAFTENLRLAAKNKGLDTEYEFVAGSHDDTDITRIKFTPSDNGSFDMRKIESRTTVRKGLMRKEISSADFDHISEQNPDAFEFIGADSPKGKYIAESTVEAIKTQTWRDPAQKELSNWIRWSNSEAERHRDGLTPATMGITGIAGLFVRLFYDKDSVMSDSFRNKTVDMAHDQVKNTGGWVLVKGGGSPAEWFEAGMKCERLLLNCRSKGIAIHPMNQMLEEPKHAKEAQKELAGSEAVQLALRAGYVDDYPDPKSLRRPVGSFAERS
jgi:hypothetical protein